MPTEPTTVDLAVLKRVLLTQYRWTRQMVADLVRQLMKAAR